MSGGHYTAFIRPDCVPGSSGGSSEEAALGSTSTREPGSSGSNLLSFSAVDDSKVSGFR